MTAEEREVLEVYRDALAYIGRCARDRRRTPRLAVDAIATIVARVFHQCGDDEPAEPSAAPAPSGTPWSAEADRIYRAVRSGQWGREKIAIYLREYDAIARAEHAAALDTGRIA